MLELKRDASKPMLHSESIALVIGEYDIYLCVLACVGLTFAFLVRNPAISSTEVRLMVKSAPDPIDVGVGLKLRQLRRVAGLSQGALGSALGVTFQQIQKYESGQNRVSASRLQQIATLLKVQPSAFFSEKNNIELTGDQLQPSDPLIDYIATVEGRALNLAYWKLPLAVRKQIVGLAQCLSG
jgi:transcriptional regulator with XRE-family HTH domain